MLNDTTPADIALWRTNNQPLLDGGEGKQLTLLTNTGSSDCPDHIVDDEPAHGYGAHWGLGSSETASADPPTTDDTVLLQTDDGSLDAGCDTDHAGTSLEQAAGLLAPPTIDALGVTGAQTDLLRKINKRERIQKQQAQLHEPPWWSTHKGDFVLPATLPGPAVHRNQMCPSGLALHHPAASTLLQYATGGCPTNTGEHWTPQQIQAAIDRGPHVSALVPDAAKQLDLEVAEKVAKGQARLVKWNDIKHDPPKNLKVSPIAMVPHKSRPYRAILDLSYSIKLSPTEAIPSVNSTTVKTAPKGSISQLGHSLGRIIHAFATAPEDSKIFMAKWDIKDGFWRLDCEDGEEWSFAYVLPSSFGTGDVTLVVPTSLQMGWIESPPYFCTASETARDVASQYAELPLTNMQDHPFLSYTTPASTDLPPMSATPFRYLIEVYVDDFIGIVIPVSLDQLNHVASSVMYGIHDVFPSTADIMDDPISNKKLVKGEGQWATIKDILGLTFDGIHKTIWLAAEKRDALILTLQKWLRLSTRKGGIPFNEFQSTLAKLQHAFLTIPAGRGLLSPFYTLLGIAPRYVFLHRNKPLCTAVHDCRTFLRESVGSPTKCRNLVSAWPDYVGLTDASAHGAGGIVIGETKSVPPTVFRVQWPADIRTAVVSRENPHGRISNSDLEMAGLLLLWLVMEDVCPTVTNAHVALFSDNSPTVHWVQRLAAKHSPIAMQLLRALALRLQLTKTSPLIPLHIAGVDNALTDIPSRSFGSEPKWHCILDRVPGVLRDQYASDFHLADAGFHRGRMEATSKNRQKYWDRWVAYVAPLGMDPHLQKTAHVHNARLLSGFAARVRTGSYGRRQQITAGAVSSAIAAVGTEISMVTGINPTKQAASDKLLPRLAQMLDGWKKDDPPTIKKLPVEVDVPELLSHIGNRADANELDRAIGDLTLIAFYYLLRVGEYTVKSSRNNTKQTVQFKLGDITFFKKNDTGQIRQLSRTAPITDIMLADSATLKLDNQKNGWKGVCIHQHANGHPVHCPVRALGRRVAHIRQHAFQMDTLLSAFFQDGQRFDVTDKDIRTSIKHAATILHYPRTRGIPVARVDTHSLRSGGANALSLSGYSDREIQKMGRWRSATFKEYIREELHCFSKGMSKRMRQKFNFVNISGGVFHDITPSIIMQPCTTTFANAA